MYLDFLVDPSFQGVKGLFVPSFEDADDRKCYKKYFLPTREIKNDNFMIYGKKCLNQPVKIDVRTYENIRKTATIQGIDYTTGWLLDCPQSKENYYLIATDLSNKFLMPI